jgi:purine-binding chemotaxis protein CheW
VRRPGERSADEERHILGERAQALARPEPRAPHADEWVDVVVFTLGSERFAIDARCALEALPLGEPTPVPGTPDMLLGLVVHRGRALPVLDLRRQLAPAAEGGELTHVVGIAAGGMTFGIAVEAVEETVRMRADELAGALLTVLDAEELAADPRLRIDDH